MNDRYRFRAWNIKHKIYHYNAETTYDGFGGNPVISKQMFYSLLNDDNYIVEQCVGLKDKNDKLIYEGDIVKETDLYERKKLVKWLDNKCGFNVSTTFGYDDGKCSFAGNVEYEVIGNIHEHGYLLENKDE